MLHKDPTLAAWGLVSHTFLQLWYAAAKHCPPRIDFLILNPHVLFSLSEDNNRVLSFNPSAKPKVSFSGVLLTVCLTMKQPLRSITFKRLLNGDTR